jgi:hypothetical protein
MTPRTVLTGINENRDDSSWLLLNSRSQSSDAIESSYMETSYPTVETENDGECVGTLLEPLWNQKVLLEYHKCQYCVSQERAHAPAISKFSNFRTLCSDNGS